jgi:hypothetical protein
MNARQIAELMVQVSKQMTLPSNEDLGVQWARRLEALSEKLADDDLYPLIALASTVYQRRSGEFERGLATGLLIKSLREAAARRHGHGAYVRY